MVELRVIDLPSEPLARGRTHSEELREAIQRKANWQALCLDVHCAVAATKRKRAQM